MRKLIRRCTVLTTGVMILLPDLPRSRDCDEPEMVTALQLNLAVDII